MKTTIFALFAVLLANNVEVEAGNGKRDDQKKKAVRSAPASNKDSKTKDTAEQTKNVRTSNGGGGQKDQKETQQKKNDNEKKSNAGNSKKQVTADNAVMETVKNDDTDLPTYLPTYLPTPLMPTASPTLDLYYVAGKADKNISLGGSKVGKGSKSGGGYVWMDTNAPTTYIPTYYPTSSGPTPFNTHPTYFPTTIMPTTYPTSDYYYHPPNGGKSGKAMGEGAIGGGGKSGKATYYQW
eukprot:scaffold13980_cov200-Alexandrium_tamarense.AAC.1